MEGGVVQHYYAEIHRGYILADRDASTNAHLVSFHVSSCNVPSPPPRVGERVVFSRDAPNASTTTQVFRVDYHAASTIASSGAASAAQPPTAPTPALAFGEVLSYFDEHGYGFIRRLSRGLTRGSVHFRVDVVQEERTNPLKRGDRVVFTERLAEKGAQATLVRRARTSSVTDMRSTPAASAINALIPGIVVEYAVQGAFGSIVKLDGSGSADLRFVIGDCDIKRPPPTVGERVLVQEAMGPKGPRASVVCRRNVQAAPLEPRASAPPKPKKPAANKKHKAPTQPVDNNTVDLTAMMRMFLTLSQETSAPTTTPRHTAPTNRTVATTADRRPSSDQYKTVIQHLSSSSDSALYAPTAIAMLAQTRPRRATAIEAEPDCETRASLLMVELGKELNAALRDEALRSSNASKRRPDHIQHDDGEANASCLDFGYTALPSPVALNTRGGLPPAPAPSPPPVPEPPRTVFCYICTDNDPIEDIFYITGCNHTYCRASIRTYILDRIALHDLAPKCPHPHCNARMSDGDFTMVLTIEEQEQYYQDCMNTAVALEPTIHKCLQEGCSGVGALRLDDPHFVCPLCRTGRCVQCNTGTWHDGLTCEQARQRGLDSQLHPDQLRTLFRGVAYQCGGCGFGPIEHYACNNVQTHHGQAVGNGRVNNACPRCGWLDGDISNWPRWDGEMPVCETQQP